VFSARNGFHLHEKDQQPEKKDKKPILIEIDVALGEGNISTEQADSVLSRIFLTSQDNFADLLPDFWKSCIAGGVAGRNESWRFSPAVASIPGVPIQPASPDLSSASSPNAPPRKWGTAGQPTAGVFSHGKRSQASESFLFARTTF
jgi:hypothetical protein